MGHTYVSGGGELPPEAGEKLIGFCE